MKRMVLIGMLLSVSLFGVEVTDMLGRKVEVEKADRLLALGPGALRLAVYMGLQSRLVGIERIERQSAADAPYRRAVPQRETLPIVGQGGAGRLPDFEALLSVRPDLILASFLSREQIRLIEQKTGIAVVALSYGGSYGGAEHEKKLQAVEGSLSLLGELTGHPARAEALLACMRSQRDRLASLGLKGRRAYIAGLGYKGAQGITSTEPDYLPFELLGVQNAVAPEGSGHRFVREEALISAAPPYLFVDAAGRGILEQERRRKPWLFERLERSGTFVELPASNQYNANIETLFANAWAIAEAMGAQVEAGVETRAVYRMFLGTESP